MKNRLKKSCAIVLGLAVSTAAGIGQAGPGQSPQSKNSPFISSQSHSTNAKVYGKTYGEWAAEWWKWALSFPADTNPILDDTGEFCDLGQSGPVWFLAGTFGATGVERDCAIPPGKAIFYPLINVTWVDAPGDEETPPDAEIYSDDDVRFIVSSFTGAGNLGCQLTSTLDTLETQFGEVPAPVTALGRPIVRAQSPKFSTFLPEGNVFGLDPGVNERLIAEGYWVMLPPLMPGEHVLNMHGAQCEIVDENGEQLIEKTFETEVTYYLNVGP